MAQEILLTSPAYIKSISNISDNVGDKMIQPAIREAQQIDLQSIIGTAMLNKIKTLIQTGQIARVENAAYNALLNECQYYLAYVVISRLVMITTFKIDNFGVNKTRDENLDIPDFSDIEAIQGYYEKKADFYAGRLQDYILEHKAELPEINESTIYAIKSNLYSSASTGIWLGGKRGKGNNRLCYIGK